MMAMTTRPQMMATESNGQGDKDSKAPAMPGQRSRKKLLALLMVWIGVTLVVIGYRNQADFNRVVKQAIVQIDSKIKTQAAISTLTVNRTSGDDGCRGFTDQPMDASIAKYFKKKPPLQCKPTPPSLLYVTEGGDSLKVDTAKVKRLRIKLSFCKYASLKRLAVDGDFKISTSAWSKAFTDSISLPKDVEHVTCQCLGGKRIVGVSYLSILRKNETLEKVMSERYQKHVSKEKPKETLSVLLVGIDGTSKLNFARQMPKTKSYVLGMGGIELYKVNKVGLNTFPNVVALLTGNSEPEIRKNWNDKEYFDKLEDKFLWHEAKDAGYRTSVILDKTKITSFHYLKKGWKNPSFTYYNRPIVVKSEADKLVRKANRHCIGDQNEISLLYDYWLQLTKTYNNSKTTPYFGYSFFAHVTHDDINKASIIDHIYLDLFTKLRLQSSLNNTLIIFFSDHGNRFGKFRSTFRGMLEDSNPFMFFIFPPWFEAKYPRIMANFRNNQHRVLTNFDIHATLKDILYFQGDDIASRAAPNRTRGLSLFQNLPDRRSCEEAGIPIKYCNCRNFSSVGVTPEIKTEISKNLLKFVIAKTKAVREKCVALTLNSTVSLMAIFTTSSTDDYYQATIHTSPGGAFFEATLKKNKKTHVVAVAGDVARTNMYRGQADCISDARVQPFCYCRNLLT